MAGANPFADAPPDDTGDDDQATDDAEDTDGLPPEFTAAYEEYEQNPSPRTMYSMIEACHASGGGGGLALLLGGKPKGKK